MFRRKKNTELANISEDLQIQNLEQLQDWVIHLVNELGLQEGQYTILPAYGGVLLYIKNQGITWVPYNEIRVIEGKIDKKQLVESSAILSGLAMVSITGGLVLPFLLIPSFLKGWYRSIAKPSPKKTMNFLQSMIDTVHVVKTDMKTDLLELFEDRSIKPEEEKDEYRYSYTLEVKRKYFKNSTTKNPVLRYLKYLTSVFTGEEVPIFAIHPIADTLKFIDALELNGITVSIEDNEIVDMPEDGIVIN